MVGIENKKKKRPLHAPERMKGRIHTNHVCVITTSVKLDS